jgi:hypothetical protein
MPATNYSADLPLSIGLQSKTATLRLMGDIQINIFSALFGSYSKRANITIDRNLYLTNEMHYTTKCQMPLI